MCPRNSKKPRKIPSKAEKSLLLERLDHAHSAEEKTMTEQETRALVARLTQAWGAKDSVVGPRCTFENGHFRFECGLASHIHLRVVGQSNTTRAAMIQWQRCELIHNDGKLKQFKPVSAEAEEWQGIEGFTALWWPHFRRGCFLSGLPLQHSEREKREWLGWYHEQGGSDKCLDFTSRRVCAAFGIKNFELQLGLDWVDGQGTIRSQLVSWRMRAGRGELVGLHWGQPWTEFSGFETGQGKWQYHVSLKSSEEGGRIARALYCLGQGTDDVLARLNYSLSAHEKLELRLSLPREFWPKTWLDEEAN